MEMHYEIMENKLQDTSKICLFGGGEQLPDFLFDLDMILVNLSEMNVFTKGL